jgi:hypothetical protein
LNRRADVVQAQLPGAFRGLGMGVFGADDLLVDQPEVGQVAAGDALILGGDGVLVYVRVPEALSIPLRSDELYLHLALRVPPEIGGPGDSAGTDSRRGAPPQLFLSENEEETDALLLASWEGDGWGDARTFSRIAALETDLTQIKEDLGYGDEERAIGSVAARLSTLENSSGDDEGGGGGGAAVTLLSQLGFNAQDPRPAITVIREEIAAAIALIAPGQRAIRQPLDLVVHELQIARGELAIAQETIRQFGLLLLTQVQREALAAAGLTIRPRVIERSQSATVGPNFGSGENFGPNFEGEGISQGTGTGDGLAKNSNGSFGVPE